MEDILAYPVTRKETYLYSLNNKEIELPTPITRSDYYLAKMCGVYDGELPAPITREDKYLMYMCENGTGVTPPSNYPTLLLLHCDKLIDDSLYANKLTLSNGISITSSGKFGGALQFTNTTIANNLEFDNKFIKIDRLETYTIDFWVHIAGSGQVSRGGTIFTVNKDDDNILSIGYNKYTPYIYVTINAQTHNIAIPNFDKWAHIAVIVDKTTNTTKGYKDGVLKLTAQETPIITDTTMMSIGYGNVGESFNDKLDEFRLSSLARWNENFAVPTAPYLADE